MLDTPKDVSIKGTYVNNSQLGGLMFWTLGGDVPTSTAGYTSLSFTYAGFEAMNASKAFMCSGTVNFSNTESTYQHVMVNPETQACTVN